MNWDNLIILGATRYQLLQEFANIHGGSMFGMMENCCCLGSTKASPEIKI